MATIALDARQISTDSIASASKLRQIIGAITVVCASVALAALVLSFDLGAIAGFLAWIGLVAILIQPRLGLYLVWGVVILFESYPQDPFMQPGYYLNTSFQSSLNANGLILIPIEILLLVTAGAWLAHGLMRRNLSFRGGSLGRAVLVFAIMLVFGVLRGLAQGAVFNFAFWESRFLFYIVICYMLASNLIRTRSQVQWLMAMVVIGGTLSGLDGAWRKFALIDAGLLGTAQESWYSHESPVFWGLVIMLMCARLAFGGSIWQRVVLPFGVIVAGFTMLVSERRAGYIAVMIAFLAFTLLLLAVKRKAFWILAFPVILAGAVYLPVFWNNTSPIGQPARAVRSLKDPDPRDAASNLSRDLEAVNVRATIASSPLTGIGFGRPFLQVVVIPDISSFPFWNFEAHHGILWVWMKIGIVGFVAFFAVMCGGLSRAATLARKLKDPEARVFAVLAMSAICMSLAFCYVDLGLTETRIPILLGTTLGTLSVLDKIYT